MSDEMDLNSLKQMGSCLNDISAALSSVEFGSPKRITLEELGDIARGRVPVRLSTDPDFLERISKGPKAVAKQIQDNHVIYGVNTGFGDSCTVNIAPELVDELPAHLVTYHGCGMGAYFTPEQSAAVLVARLTSLAKGFSGVRLELLQQLTALIQNGIYPRIPQEGSVGASGDLTPLSYVASALCGFRDCVYKGQVMSCKLALEQAGLKPITLIPKEGLALMNGTAVMTGVGALCYLRAAYLSRLCTRLTSLAITSLKGNRYHYDATLFSVKEHFGQQNVAEWIRSDLEISDAPNDYSLTGRKQCRYSLRCAPHIIGVLEDALPFFRRILEAELNSANDNPIVDAETGRIFHGGMFYGGHVAFVMDSLKTLVANLADLMDRQLALMVDTNYNNGLPRNLSGAQGPRAAINHGLKGIQISSSAWTAEALKQTMPASVFSRSTECHNQDKVSMGTIAARDCVRVLELTEQVASTMMVAVRQALTIRQRDDPEFELTLSADAHKFLNKLKSDIPFITEDIFTEPTLRQLVKNIQDQAYPIGY